MKEVSLKDAQSTLQKTITWKKKSQAKGGKNEKLLANE
jgi:hypothetical protein